MTLKIIYKTCCGIDVHKTFVVACIASTNSCGVTTYKSHRFFTYTKGLKELLQWLLDSNCKDVCMESTGKYWIPAYNILENGVLLYLHILNMLRLFVVIKLTRKMRNGLLTCLSAILLPVALCRLAISVSFVTLCAIVTN